MSRRPAEPDDDQPEVEDLDVRTIVYDDVDGDVVEQRQLPAPAAVKPAASAVVKSSAARGDATVRRELATTAREPAREPDGVRDRQAALQASGAGLRESEARLRDRDVDARDRDTGLRRVVAAKVAVKAGTVPRSAGTSSPTDAARPTSEPPNPTAAPEPQPSRPMPATRRSSSSPRSASSSPSRTVDAPVENGVVCPFCAHVREPSDAACPRCTMADTPSTRRSTGERIGPWFVLQRKNPTAPGLRFSVILALARRGHVTARSIVRGPTTGQLWRYAGEVKGLSRLFGVCWHCRAGVSPDATTCPKCKSAQEVPDDPDAFLESHAAATAQGMSDGVGFSSDEIPAPTAADFASSPTAFAPVEREPAAPVERSAPRERAKPRAEAERPSRPAHKPTARNGGIDPLLSASELAAVFQMPSNDPPPAGAVRRTARGVWYLVRVGAIAAIVVGAAGAVTLYVKPEWREPARLRAEAFANTTRDAATRAGTWTREKATAGWHATTATLARWRNQENAPNSDAPANKVAAPTNAIDPATPPAPTPIRVDSAARPAAPKADVTAPKPSAPAPKADAKIETPAGAPSIVDATPQPQAQPKPQAAVPALPPEQSWDSILGDASKRPAATQPAAPAAPAPMPETTARANAAEVATATEIAAAAEGGPPPTAGAPTTAPDRSPEEVQAAIEAALRDADKALADAQGKVRRAGLPGEVQSQQQLAQPQPQPNPNAVGPHPPGVTPQPSVPQPTPITAMPPANVAPTMSLDEAMNKAATLRQTAIDAEARRDYRAALKVWEEIEKLPEAARPSDLKARLKIARDRVNR